MQDRRFDEFATALAKGTNRRGAIKVLAGSLAGALLGIGGGRSGAAKPGKCPPSRVCGTACCPDGYACVDGACTTDVPAVVPEDTGKGGAGCPAGHKRCASHCVDLASDVNNCGACGKNCTTVANATTVCSSGGCGYVCNQNFGDCDLSAANGCETNTASDVSNCGACGYSCADNKPATTSVVVGCATGVCQYTCAACGRNATCVGGICVCNANYTDCDGDGNCECPTEVSIDHAKAQCEPDDPDDPSSRKRCYVTCDAGYYDRNDDLADPATDSFNTATDGCECDLTADGVCNCTDDSPTVGVACPTGQRCCRGVCEVPPDPPTTCDGILQNARLIR